MKSVFDYMKLIDSKESYPEDFSKFSNWMASRVYSNHQDFWPDCSK